MSVYSYILVPYLIYTVLNCVHLQSKYNDDNF